MKFFFVFLKSNNELFIKIATNVSKKCTIGSLEDCGVDEVCVQYNMSETTGRCVCRNENKCIINANNDSLITTIKPLPIYSMTDNKSSYSEI